MELGEHLQSTIYNLQSVELGGLLPADMRVYPTVHAPVFASRCARLLPASLRYAETGRRDRPRFQARAAAYAELCYLCAVRRGTLKFVNRKSSLVLGYFFVVN